MPIEIINQQKRNVPIKWLREKLEEALGIINLEDKEANFILVDDELITFYNTEYLDRPYPTNVISFSQYEGPFIEIQPSLLGDVIISVDTAYREAEEYGLPQKHYLLMLAIHGLLHLLGHEHEGGPYGACLMLKKEIDLIQKLLGRKAQKITSFLRRREYMPAKLAVNVDHVATVREARKVNYPDPVHAAVLAELGGAHGIVVHLREDRRHIQDRDVRLLREIVKTKLILEMAATEEMISFAREVKPDQVTLVPERRQEITTEGGLKVKGRIAKVRKAVEDLKEVGLKVSIFIDPEVEQIKAAAKTGADIVELHTGHYAEANGLEEMDLELSRLEEAARVARELGFEVHAGHGLHYQNISPVAAIPYIEEFSIGHAIVARAIMVGMKEAVEEMLFLIEKAR
ncbi:pyridoxal phosphate biosynthetic protein PdxJ [Thermodesulfatator indicus DSM 15286]|uniref:Multifunctional fusion protein n=1 Tax=Thermodesulfatator indicus (strain DSM 15286 / JCM 11887 / CIR29812) TaxID=667014 RepID=F8A996_THEID|nr:pyridoxine 5'-phosphate synthase [Thermodesulfatator indicus]AEH45356.1 pyridoxal phosphate biosynthetic protein PdxJ [Thermodesulfatator indicus DSM 15286]